ncbi:unnamed protein product [Didymodactylos carnosus]|uniref:Uncharacterized protein n=1 Tax=Didymodactylos carnosus TaxID=1234261 RepID=A0A8S2D4G8_9BILA|nr:unnamed protein product [Didymodactylos carnosus]CAF3585771.1 unnamed protein product [Didymodactylos carnosus]
MHALTYYSSNKNKFRLRATIDHLPKTRSNAGDKVTLTNFEDDQTLQCGNHYDRSKVVAVNPRLFGVSDSDWINKYKDAEPNSIPWCGKQIRLTVNGGKYNKVFTIADTCQPCAGKKCDGAPKCDYDNVIDFATEQNVREILKAITGENDDGLVNTNKVSWQILN